MLSYGYMKVALECMKIILKINNRFYKNTEVSKIASNPELFF
ncbi:hypothetical protein LEP1GSC073_3020 [Leptospira noguchii str. Cascata]|nr:hypothetical protein LEP1GSC073_3020 [Leptospira noguchii str. Cascata]